MMADLILSLGSNMGNRSANLVAVKERIQNALGEIITESGIYETAPWGFSHKSNFYNQVVVCKTSLIAEKAISEILTIEKKMGRIRQTDKYVERIIDIDILFYNHLVLCNEFLTIPHPHLHERRFVLEPLCEILPGYVHPLLDKPIKQLLKECNDTLYIKKLDG